MFLCANTAVHVDTDVLILCLALKRKPIPVEMPDKRYCWEYRRLGDSDTITVNKDLTKVMIFILNVVNSNFLVCIHIRMFRF